MLINILARFRKHDRQNNLPVWTALTGLCFSMVLFSLAVKHAWNELRNYACLCKEADLSAAMRQREFQLAFMEARKNPAPQKAVKPKRKQQRVILIKQASPANNGAAESDVVKNPPAPGSPDTDNDGLYDAEEEALGTDWRRPDTDGDGINDGAELKMDLDPASYDNLSNGAGEAKLDALGDGALQFGTFSYSSSEAGKPWIVPPPKPKRGRKR